MDPHETRPALDGADQRAARRRGAPCRGVEVVAIGSRERARAEAQAQELGVPRAHGSYEALLADPDVEAVYIALPNSLHVEWSLRALQGRPACAL